MYINIGFCQSYILESLLVVVGFTQLYCIFQNLCTSSLFLFENKWSHLESIGFILLFTDYQQQILSLIFYDFYTNIEWFEPHSVFQIGGPLYILSSVLQLFGKISNSTKLKFVQLCLVVKGVHICPLCPHGLVWVVHHHLHMLHWVLAHNMQVLELWFVASLDKVSNLTTTTRLVVVTPG